MKSSAIIRNKTWTELRVGDRASIERACSVQDLLLFAHVSGNTNPLTLPANGDAPSGLAPVAPSMWVGSLISAVLGNLLPGPGTMYRSQSLEFRRRVHIGDRLTVSVACCEKRESPTAVFEAEIRDSAGAVVCKGEAVVDAPTTTIEMSARELPGLIIDSADHFARLIALAVQLPKLRAAIVCPEDRNSLGGARLSVEAGLIEPILIGDRKRVFAAAADLGLDISGWRLVEEIDSRAAAHRAVALVLAGEANSIMKGVIHSDELLAAVVRKEGGLRGVGRISHVFALDVPTLEDILFVSDAAINIAPDLLAKVDITQNAIDLARACGLELPRVGVLSAVETITPNIPSTLDAAILSKMAERGQIKGAIVDGPLAMDNAIDMEAARTKGIASLVAGRANVLIVPNIEAGNMLAKELIYIARAEAAGLVIGARVPIMLTSRADNDRSRLASCALAALYNYWRLEGRAFDGEAREKRAAE